MMSYEKFEACPLCGSPDIPEIPKYQLNFLVKCADCNFVYCGRKPSKEELTAHYNQYPRGTTISPITVSRYSDLCDTFDNYRKTNNILDVGCGDGHFLVEARKRGWNVFGTEFTEEAVEVCAQKGIHMIKGALSDVHVEAGYFDIITSFEVIEHTNNPKEEASILFKLLRPGGLIYVTTPNFDSISRVLLGAKWNVIEYPEHLCYFTKRTITRLLRDAGFERVRVTSIGISLERIRRSSGNINPEAVDGLDEGLRRKAELNPFFQLLKSMINMTLNFLGRGDALKASFVKR